MKSKLIPSSIILICLIFLGYSFVNYFTYIDKKDSIRDDDEKLIKKFRSHHNYSLDELKGLEIEYLDEIDGYRIYLVEFDGNTDMGSLSGWDIDEYVFPIGASTRIIGIKDDNLYVSGKLIYETAIDIDRLYELVYRLYD